MEYLERKVIDYLFFCRKVMKCCCLVDFGVFLFLVIFFSVVKGIGFIY